MEEISDVTEYIECKTAQRNQMTILSMTSPKGEIVGIMRQVLSLMENHTFDKL